MATIALMNHGKSKGTYLFVYGFIVLR